MCDLNVLMSQFMYSDIHSTHKLYHSLYSCRCSKVLVNFILLKLGSSLSMSPLVCKITRIF